MLVRDYYTIELPGDMADDMETLMDYAINEARERTRLYCMPATWTCRKVAGEVGDFVVKFQVCRVRNKPEKAVK